MPDKRGPNTYQGFQSPNTRGWPKPIRSEVRHVYGRYREKHPQEDQAIKSRGSRIAWSAARRKYPKEYAQHVRRERLNAEIRKEQREHPTIPRKTIKQIASDHVTKEDRAHRQIREMQIGEG